MNDATLSLMPVILLGLCLVPGFGCQKGSTSADAGAMSSAVPRRPEVDAWDELFRLRLGTGEFDVQTTAEATTSPLSGRRCAYLRVTYLEATDANEKRFGWEQWPEPHATLQVDGKRIAVPSLNIELPAIEKELVAGPDVPARAKALFDKGVLRLKATEHCLAPGTTYRAELRERPPLGLELDPRAPETPLRELRVLR